MSLEFDYYSLGDLVKIKYGKNQKKVQDDENGKYPILDDTGSQTGKYLEPININQMYRSFLKICQSEEEIIK